MNEHFKPYPIADEQWNGEAYHCVGSEWRLEDGTIQKGKRYDCWFGGAETVTVDGVEILASCEIKVKDTLFILRNLYFPHIIVSNIPKNLYLSSEKDSSALIGEEIMRAVHSEPFQSHVGKLFLNRAPKALNYSFCPILPLSLDDLKYIPVGTVLWCDYRERVAGKEQELLPVSPVEFCGLGRETFEDTPEPVIYYSDGLDYQSEYGFDFVLWAGKPTDEARLALDLTAYRRAAGG